MGEQCWWELCVGAWREIFLPKCMLLQASLQQCF